MRAHRLDLFQITTVRTLYKTWMQLDGKHVKHVGSVLIVKEQVSTGQPDGYSLMYGTGKGVCDMGEVGFNCRKRV